MGGVVLWARREIQRGWVSLTVVALLVGISGSGVMAGLAGARRAASSVDRFLAASSFAELTLYTQGSPVAGDLRRDLAADPRIESLAQSQVVLATPAGLTPGLDGATIVVPDEFWGGRVHPRLVQGRFPVGPNEILMSEQGVGRGPAVGDTVTMKLLSGELLAACFAGGDCTGVDSGRVTIVGMVRMSGDLAPGPFGNNLYVAPAAFLQARGGDAVTLAYNLDVFTVDGADLDAIIAEYSVRVPDGDFTNATVDDVAGARRAVAIQRDALMVAALIVAVAGLLIVSQAFGRFLTRRPSDAAALCSLGMSAGQRATAAWLPGLLGAFGGAILTMPLAVVMSWGLPQGVARRADPDIGFHADWLVLGPGAVVTFAVGACCALAAALLWSRTSVSGTAGSVSTAGALARRLHFSPTAAMGSRFALEPGRGARRTPVVPSLVGSVAAVAVLIGTVTFNSSLDGLLTTPSRYGAPWDLQVTAWGGQESHQIADRVAADERVKGVALAVSGELNVAAHGSAPVQGFAVGMSSVKGSVDPVVLEGRAPAAPNEVVVGTDVLERLHVAIDDEVQVSGPLGERTMVVVGRAIVPVLGSQHPDSGVVVPLQTMLDLGGTQTVADVDAEPAVFATVAEGVDIGRVRSDFESQGAKFEGPFQQSAVSALDELRTIPALMSAFVVLLGVLASFHTLQVTARRRRSDLAVLRALGQRPGQVAAIIRWQGGVTAAAALVVGIPIGLIGGRLLWRSIADGSNVPVVVDVPWHIVVVACVGAVSVSSFLLAAWPARTARRRPPGPDLRAE